MENKKVTFHPPLQFFSLGLHLLCEPEAEEEGETHIFGQAHTSAPVAATLTFFFTSLRQKYL